MSAVEMYDYLSAVVADNNETLSVQPSHTITEIGTFNDEIRKGDDGSEERVRLGSSIPEFYVNLYWENGDSSDIGTVFDFYFNAAKGNGNLESFKWSHPNDGYLYTVRFDGALNRTITNPNIHSIPSCRLRVLGRSCEELSIKDTAHNQVSGVNSITRLRSISIKDTAHNQTATHLTIIST